MQAKRLKSRTASSATVFAALGDERRLKVVARLCRGGPVSITTLASDSDVSRQAITKHLHVLARAGLVRSARRGREHFYELEPKQIEQAQEYLAVIARQWDAALGRLKSLAEAEEL